MTNVVPGANWQPVDWTGRAARRKGRGAAGHVAVSGAANLPPTGVAQTRASDWHFYLPKDPTPTGQRFYQYIDLDVQCWASSQGNATLPAWESQGGLGTAADVNAEPWSDNQVEAAAMIYAYLAESEGAPLQLMPDSLPASRGLATHRLGIDPWRVAGGESWSSSRGKICPGDAKIAQLPVILSRAGELLHGSASAPVIVPAAYSTPLPAPVPTPPTFGWDLPAGAYYGALSGPAASRGGATAAERAHVKIIQQWLIYHGCVAGLPSSAWSTSGWADGIWGPPTSLAMSVWHARHYPGQPQPAQCWSDDARRLMVP